MKKIILFIAVTMFFGLNVLAQEDKCGMEVHMAEKMKDPDFARQWEINQAKFKKAVAQSLSFDQRQNMMDEHIVIPVAVHFPTGLESDRACLEALAQSQIDVVNQDFTATNADANLWGPASGFYPGVVHGAANIQFCIATIDHPAGTDDDLVEGGPAVTIGYDFGPGDDTDPAWAGYLNFLVLEDFPPGFGSSVVGYSPLGGNINQGAALVLRTYAFGTGAGCADSDIEPGNGTSLGRTTTHELGHYFNLQHTFDGDSCSADDGIEDTPNIDGENFGCPNPGSVPGCEPGEFALTMSYMDYTNDACMYMFSQGQIDVAENYIGDVLVSQFKPNVTPVCVEIPEYIITNGTVTACNGLFYDSGGPEIGPDPGNYGNNEIFTYTICPETPGQAIRLSFTQFETQQNVDIITIYNADDATDPATILGEWSGTDSPGTINTTLTNTSGCLTVVFTSNADATYPGWRANIQCVSPPAECQEIIAQLDSISPSPNAEGVIQVCQGEEITLVGSGLFSEPGGGTGAAYEWEIGDGTTINSQTATFSFDEPGLYIANLNIWDINTSVFPEGCKNDNRINQYINVSTNPSFGTTDDTVNPICFGDTSTVTALVTPTPYINECTPPESNVRFLPDGTGLSYESSIVVNCFEPDEVLEDINQISQICLVIEHSYLGDLDIEIIAPSGQTVLLQGQAGGSANLGIPWATGPIDGDSDNTTQGVGSQYCFVADDTFPSLEDVVDIDDFPDGDTGNTYQDIYVPEGTYSSDEPLDALVGTFLNGNWSIRITDYLSQDNGYIFSWSLDFNYENLSTVGSFTPEIVSGAWTDDDPTITDINGDTITIEPDGEGQFCYNYTVLDNFGCEYSGEICVDVLPELVRDTPNDLFVCDPVTSAASFNLFQNEAVVLAPNPNPGDFVVTFHNSQADAENDDNEIVNLNTYTGADQELIYVRFEYQDSNCFEIDTFQLNVLAAPDIFPTTDLLLCDDETNDGVEAFDLEQRTLDILGDQLTSQYSVTYYLNDEDADLGINTISSPHTNTTNPEPIYVRVETIGGSGCYVASRDPVFNLVVTNQAVAATPDDLVECDTTNSGILEASFDLETQTPIILGGQDPATFTVTYHISQADADAGLSPISSPFTGPTQTIYVRVEQAGVPECYGSTEFEIRIDPIPSVIPMTPLDGCDEDDDGFGVFTLTDKDDEALNGQTGLTVSYHATEADAEAGTTAIGPSYTNVVPDNEQVWIRLTNTAAGCHSIIPLDLIVNPIPLPESATVSSLCDDDTDGLQTFDLSSVAAQVIGAQTDMQVSYHFSLADAQSASNALGTNVSTTTPDSQTIYIRLENSLTGCYAVSTIDLVVNSLPVVILEDDYVICSDASGGGLDYAEVDPGLSAAIYSFAWRDESGTLLSEASTYTVETGGIYSLEVSYLDGIGCSAPLEFFTVNESESPVVTATVTTEPFADTHIIESTANGSGVYEFSLDQGPWQDSGIFVGVSPGEHSVNVRDVNGCGVTSYILFVIDFPAYFTPNGDGYNDSWNVTALSSQLASKIYIFDRYGKLLKQISPAGDGWDGTYNGQRMPTSDYWFLLEYNDFDTGTPKQLRAHFTLKR